MNILYISKLDGRPWVGPSYSVPNQIAAQTKYDNVFWYNLVCKGDWKEEGRELKTEWEKLSYYHDKTEFPSETLSELPVPFCNPDLIIFEQCYQFAKEPIRKHVLKTKIPYIIIPRGEFTVEAQHKHFFKKLFGNVLLRYHCFLKKALAIHCLTKLESQKTSLFWNSNRIIIPNGVLVSRIEIKRNNKNNFTLVSIGRYEPFQKGLDILLEVIDAFKEIMLSKNIKVLFYGSNVENKRKILEEMSNDRKLNELVSFNGPVFGDEKKKILMESDVFLMPSRFEGHPTGLLEALSFGLPCLVTKGSNMREEIENAEAGWGADNSADSLKRAFAEMLNDIDNLYEKRKNAYQLACKYSWDSIAKETHSEYLRLLRNRGV